MIRPISRERLLVHSHQRPLALRQLDVLAEARAQFAAQHRVAQLARVDGRGAAAWRRAGAPAAPASPPQVPAGAFAGAARGARPRRANAMSTASANASEYAPRGRADEELQREDAEHQRLGVDLAAHVDSSGRGIRSSTSSASASESASARAATTYTSGERRELASAGQFSGSERASVTIDMVGGAAATPACHAVCGRGKSSSQGPGAPARARLHPSHTPHPSAPRRPPPRLPPRAPAARSRRRRARSRNSRTRSEDERRGEGGREAAAKPAAKAELAATAAPAKATPTKLSGYIVFSGEQRPP